MLLFAQVPTNPPPIVIAVDRSTVQMYRTAALVAAVMAAAALAHIHSHKLWLEPNDSRRQLTKTAQHSVIPQMFRGVQTVCTCACWLCRSAHTQHTSSKARAQHQCRHVHVHAARAVHGAARRERTQGYVPDRPIPAPYGYMMFNTKMFTRKHAHLRAGGERNLRLQQHARLDMMLPC